VIYNIYNQRLIIKKITHIRPDIHFLILESQINALGQAKYISIWPETHLGLLFNDIL
jgi:hypothetical protein